MPIFSSRAVLQPTSGQVATLTKARNLAHAAHAWTIAQCRSSYLGGKLPSEDALITGFFDVLDARMPHLTVPVPLLASIVAGAVREARKAFMGYATGQRQTMPKSADFKGAIRVTLDGTAGHVARIAGLGAVRMWEEPRLMGSVICVKIRQKGGLWIVNFSWAVSEYRRAA